MAQEPAGELSARECEILELVATGATNQQIAQELTISVNTVKAHLRNIFAKLGVESRTEATLYGIRQGLVKVPLPSGAIPTVADVPRPPIPEPRLVRWPLLPGQGLALLVAMAVVLAAVLWPGTRSSGLSDAGPFVDLPQSESRALEPANVSRWQARSSMPTPRGRFAQAEVDGIIYVIGGLTERGWSSEVEAYDPEADRWDRRASKPTAVANVGAAAVDGLIYVPGGFDQVEAVRDVLEVYDPAADAWSTAAPLPVGLCSYAIVAYGGGFYLFGGWDGQRYVDSVYYYDAAADAWQRGAPLSSARAFAAAAAARGRIYVLGGYDGSIEYDSCESYDPTLAAAGKPPWRTHQPMSTGRAGHSALVSERVIYVVGGGWDSYLAYNERYDVANDVWSTFESPLVGEWRSLGLSSAPTRSGTFLYAIGGWSGRYLAVVRAYRVTFRVYVP